VLTTKELANRNVLEKAKDKYKSSLHMNYTYEGDFIIVLGV
jgi:hypothetical protein